MKKVLLAINDKKLIKKIKENKNINLVNNNLQYREAILEILEKNKNIDFILINENLPGLISIEKLIKKIKIINNKINIIFFLEKYDINKKNRLKVLNINNIYYDKKININKILNLINKNNYKIENKINNNKIKKKEEKSIKINSTPNKKIIKVLINKIMKDNSYKIKKNKKNKIITIMGKKKTGKTTIINLLLIYLLEKNKKILLINLNKKIENNYFDLIRKKYHKIKNSKNNFLNNNSNKKMKNIFSNLEIKINNNLIFLYNFQNIFQGNNSNSILEYFNKYYIKKYDYILVDIGNNAYSKIRQQLIDTSDKRLIIIEDNLLGVKELRELTSNYEKMKKEDQNGLHIIINKYYFNSISKLILKNIIDNQVSIDFIFYNQKIKNINIKKDKIKLNMILKNKIKNILFN